MSRPIEYDFFAIMVGEITTGSEQPQRYTFNTPIAINEMHTSPLSPSPNTPAAPSVPQSPSTSESTSLAIPPSPSPPPSASAPAAAPQGGRRTQIKLITRRSPLKDDSRGLTRDDTPQAKFIPGPNSNSPRNYDNLPASEQMAKYVEENKELLAKLVKFESEGYLARIDFNVPSAPVHTPIKFESEPEADQKVLNEVLHENFCFRLRVQCLTEAKRWYQGEYPGEEITMSLYGNYHFKVTFPYKEMTLCTGYRGLGGWSGGFPRTQ